MTILGTVYKIVGTALVKTVKLAAAHLLVNHQLPALWEGIMRCFMSTADNAVLSAGQAAVNVAVNATANATAGAVGLPPLPPFF